MNDINYVFWIVIMFCVVGPFYLVGGAVLIEDDMTRKKAFILGGIIWSIIITALFYLQMNIEVVYGKELIDYWHASNPSK